MVPRSAQDDPALDVRGHRQVHSSRQYSSEIAFLVWPFLATTMEMSIIKYLYQLFRQSSLHCQSPQKAKLRTSNSVILIGQLSMGHFDFLNNFWTILHSQWSHLRVCNDPSKLPSTRNGVLVVQLIVLFVFNPCKNY